MLPLDAALPVSGCLADAPGSQVLESRQSLLDEALDPFPEILRVPGALECAEGKDLTVSLAPPWKTFR
jgi:hypothetical protein